MRIALAAIGFIGALVAPPWLPLACIVLLAIRYRAWEVIFIGLLLDLAWQPMGMPLSTLPVYTFLSIAIVWLFEPLRVQFLR